MTMTSAQLINRIEELRKEMTDVALKKGINSAESISLSQELDALLNEYEKFKCHQDD